MVYAVAAIRGSGKRRALTTWYANSIKIIKQRDAGKRIGRLLAAQTEALMRTALMRRAFLFFRLRAAALVVAAFEARMAVLMDDNVPVDPYVLTIHRKNTQRKYLTVWNRGVAARRRVLALWARSEEARALRKWRAVCELAHMLRGLAHTMMTNLYRRLRVQGIHNWRLNAIARRTLKALSGNLIRTSRVAMMRVGFSALRRVASVRRVLAGFFRAAVTLQMGKAARHALNVLRSYASGKRMLGSLRYKHRTAAVKLCLLGWHRRAYGLQATRRAKKLAIQRWARMREFGAMDRWQSQVQKRHALRRALRYLLHREISRGFVTWGAFVSTRSAQRATLRQTIVRIIQSRKLAALNSWSARAREELDDRRWGLRAGWFAWVVSATRRRKALYDLRKCAAELRRGRRGHAWRTWRAYIAARSEAIAILIRATGAWRGGVLYFGFVSFEAKLRTARRQRAAVRFWLHRWTTISIHQWKRATLIRQRTISIAKKAFGFCCITAMRVGFYRWSLARKSRFVMRRASMLYGDNQRLRHCADALIRMREYATRHRMTLVLARQTSSTWILASKRTALLALRKGARNLADKLKTLTLARLGVLTAKLSATWALLKANIRALQRALVHSARIRGFLRGSYLNKGLRQWLLAATNLRIATTLSDLASPHRPALRYALRIMRAYARERAARYNLIRTLRKQYTHARLSAALQYLRERFSKEALRSQHVLAAARFVMSEGTRRGILGLMAWTERRLANRRAQKSYTIRRVRRAWHAWHATNQQLRSFAALHGGARLRSRQWYRRRGFTALRAYAGRVRLVSAVASLSAEGRVQSRQMSISRAIACFAANAAECHRVQNTALVVCQRNKDRRTAALLQPLRVLVALRLARTLHQWCSAAEMLPVDERLRATHAALAAEHRRLSVQHAQEEELRRQHLLEQQAYLLEQQRLSLFAEPLTPAAVLCGRSTLDKLFGVLELWEACTLRPALHAWHHAAAAMPAPTPRTRARLYSTRHLATPMIALSRSESPQIVTQIESMGLESRGPAGAGAWWH